MINPGRSASQSLELQLFEPSPDAIYAIEAVAQMTNVPRHTILVYCRYKLLKRADDTSEYGYYFSGDAIRTLRRIEALRSVCGDDFAGIRIILELTAMLERMRLEIASLNRKSPISPGPLHRRPRKKIARLN
jgi:hypothetical protein